jgi:hypothetical protein
VSRSRTTTGRRSSIRSSGRPDRVAAGALRADAGHAHAGPARRAQLAADVLPSGTGARVLPGARQRVSIQHRSRPTSTTKGGRISASSPGPARCRA